MRQTEGVREAWLRFCERLSAGDVASFDELVSQEPAALIIGTAPGEWVTERERMRFGFETEGLRLEAKNPVGYEEGSLGWVVDQPAFVFPDGSVMQSRLTAVVHKEEGRWKLVHSTSPSVCPMSKWSSYSSDGRLRASVRRANFRELGESRNLRVVAVPATSGMPRHFS